MKYQQLIADIRYQQFKIKLLTHAIRYGGNVAYWQQMIESREKIIEKLKISLKSVI